MSRRLPSGAAAVGELGKHHHQLNMQLPVKLLSQKHSRFRECQWTIVSNFWIHFIRTTNIYINSYTAPTTSTPLAATYLLTGNDLDVLPIRSLVHEVLTHSHASGIVLQTALCYLEAVHPEVPSLLRVREARLVSVILASKFCRISLIMLGLKFWAFLSQQVFLFILHFLMHKMTKSYINIVRLIIIYEIHLLHDSQWMSKTFRRVDCQVRLVGLSSWAFYDRLRDL